MPAKAVIGINVIGQVACSGAVQVRYRYRLYPASGQQQMLARTFGCARVVYNDCLRVRDEAYAAGEKISDTEVQRRVVTLAKQTPGRAWLGEVSRRWHWFRRARTRGAPTGTGSIHCPGKRKGRKIGKPSIRAQAQRQSVRLTRNGFSLHGERLYVAEGR